MTMFKLSLKQLIRLLLVTFSVALLLSVIPTWLDWWENVSGLFQTEAGTNWSVVWETLSSWLWPLWLLLVALGYLGIVVVRLVFN